MAYEGLRGAVARGANAGASIVNAAANSSAVRQRGRAQNQIAMQARADQISAALKDDRDWTVKAADEMAGAIVEAKRNGYETAEMEQALEGLLMSHAARTERISVSAADSGAPLQFVEALSGSTFMSQTLPVYRAKIDATRPDVPTGDWINLRNRDTGEERTVRSDSDEAASLTESGWLRVGIPGRSLETGDPNVLFGSNDPRTDSQVGSDYSDDLDRFNNSSDVQEVISSALPTVQETPGAVGTRGRVGMFFSGLAAAAGQEEMAAQISEQISNASPEEVAAIMAELQVVRGKIIPMVTGQESRARLSDKEQELGDRAVALLNEIKGPADLSRAYPQVIGALSAFYVESWAEQYRIAAQNADIDFRYDLSNDDDLMKLADTMLADGLDKQTVKRALGRLDRIQRGAQ